MAAGTMSGWATPSTTRARPSPSKAGTR
jgi:hypothetical protein